MCLPCMKSSHDSRNSILIVFGLVFFLLGISTIVRTLSTVRTYGWNATITTPIPRGGGFKTTDVRTLMGLNTFYVLAGFASFSVGLYNIAKVRKNTLRLD